MTDTGDVQALAFSPNGHWLASGGTETSIKLWEVATGREVQTLTGRGDSVSAVIISPDGRWMASVNRDLTLWELPSGREVESLPGGVTTLAFNPAGRVLLGKIEKSNAVRVWEPGGPEILMQAGPEFRRGVRGVLAFSSDGRRVASLGLDPLSLDVRIDVWELPTGRILNSQPERGVWAFTLALSPDGRLLALASLGRNTVKLWDLVRKQEVRTFIGRALRLAFSPDGRWLAASSWPFPDEVKLWEVETGQEMRTLPGQTAGFSPDARWLAVGGSGGTLKLLEVTTGRELRSFTHPGFQSHWDSVFFAQDGRWLASAGPDGTRVWDTATGEELARLIAMPGRKEWMAVTPEGLFDGSQRGMQKLVAWRIGNHVYPPDRFFADYYTPGLLTRIFAGERPKPKIDLASLKLPPNVHITSPPSATTLKQERAAVNVEATDLGGGIAEVRLYQNGKLVGTDQATRGKGKYSFEVSLVPGENILKATAFSQERVESNEDWVRVVFEAPQTAKPALYLLVVGVNQYEDRSFNLGFARQDGEAIARFFEERGRRLFSEVNTLKLFDQQATRPNIEKAFAQLAERVRPEDVALVYLAGHGVGLGQQFYFLPHEMRTEPDQQAAVRKYGITAPTLGDALRRIPALKQVLILDTCEAETALPILAKVVMFRGLGPAERKATEMLARSTGVYLIAASTKQQKAVEVPQLGHGVLTYALLSALGEKGKPQAPTTPDGLVTMLLVLQYVNQQVPELTEKYHGEKQYPVSWNTGMDFPLLVR